MSGSYLIIVGHRALDHHAAAGLTLSHEQNHVAVWTDRPVIPFGGLGCAIGHVFSKCANATPICQFDAIQSRGLETSAGHSLITDFWGGHISLLGLKTDEIVILRDPSGSVPCYFGRTKAGIALSSDAWRLVSLIGASRPIDYSELARFLAFPQQSVRTTCIKDIHELLPGEALTLKDQVLGFESWWSPCNFIGASTRTAAQDVELLGRTVQDCVARWASCFDNIVLGVSGGLDSSIVGEACVSAGRSVRCLTMVGPDSSSDETNYARTLTDALSLPLSIHRYDLDAIDIDRTVLGHLPRPLGAYFQQGLEQAHVTLAREQPIDAFFTGHGGDNVFCSIRSAAPLLDRLHDDGIGSGALKTLRDLAELTGASFATIVRLAFRIERHRYRPARWRADLTGLNENIVQHLSWPGPVHPWIEFARGATPGKRAHLAMISSALSSMELYDRRWSPPQIAPLLSQPVIETCLSIPSWRWIADGVDRSIARRAFRGSLPDVLLDRTSKGGPDGFMHSIYRLKGSELKAMLKNGLLMANGVLDPSFVDQPDDPTWRGKPRARRMMSLGIAEAWAQHWASLENFAS